MLEKAKSSRSTDIITHSLKLFIHGRLREILIVERQVKMHFSAQKHYNSRRNGCAKRKPSE